MCVCVCVYVCVCVCVCVCVLGDGGGYRNVSKDDLYSYSPIILIHVS